MATYDILFNILWAAYHIFGACSEKLREIKRSIVFIQDLNENKRKLRKKMLLYMKKDIVKENI